MKPKPMTWEFIKEICDRCDRDNSDLPICSIDQTRSDIIENKYKEWKLSVGENYLYDKIFGNNNYDAVLRLNDFPYNFETDIIHYVVWLRPSRNKYKFTPRMDKSLLDKISEQLNNNDINNLDMIHFRNTPNNRTINSIDHYHLLFH